MKKIRVTTVVVTILISYTIGMLIGIFTIWAIPFWSRKADLLEIAEDMGNHYKHSYRDADISLFGMEYFLFTSEGRQILNIHQFLREDEALKVKQYVPQLMEDGTIFRPAQFYLESDDSNSRKVYCIVLGVTVVAANGDTYCSILVRDLADLNTTLKIFAVIYTLIYLTAAVFILLIYKKTRELNEMRRDLIANVSHELKTPITAIRAMAEVLHDGIEKDPSARRDYCRAILGESDKLERMVMDILELSRLQSHKTDFKKSYVHADGIFPPTIDSYKMLCGDLNINFDTSALNLAEIPTLYTDVQKINSLLSILLDNAVKFVGSGGSIWLTQEIHSKYVTFCVKDNGPGIAKKDINRIFDRFYKADIAHNSNGSGLGLAIADEIALGLDEKLWVNSTFSEGSEFYFTVGF